MRFIDNQRIVSLQKRITLRFRQQNPIGHQLDVSLGADFVRKADFVTNRLPQRAIQFSGNARSHRARSNTAWLGVPDQSVHATLEFQADFRDLRGFARPGLTTNDDYLMLLDCLLDFLAPRIDR